MKTRTIKENRVRSREERRREWNALRVEFLLAGGDACYLVPFNHNWRAIYARMLNSLERGEHYYTQKGHLYGSYPHHLNWQTYRK